MKPMISVLTCPGRQEYVRRTLEILTIQNFVSSDMCLFIDGPSHEYDSSFFQNISPWKIIPWFLERPEGTVSAMLKILTRAQRSGCDYLLYFEDDIQLNFNSIQAMHLKDVPDDCAFLTFCDLRHVKKMDPSAGPKYVHKRNGWDLSIGDPFKRGHWGNQALKIPKRTLDYIVKQPIPAWFEGKYGCDALLGIMTASGNSPWQYYGICKSIVNHIGSKSLVSPGAPLGVWGRSPNDFDSMFNAMDIV